MKRLFFIGILFFILTSCATKQARIDDIYEQKIPEPILVRIELAERYIMDLRPREALRQLLTVQNSAYKYARFHFDLGMAYLALDERQKAIDSFSKAVKLSPAYGEAWNNLGLVYFASGNNQKAEKCFKKALSILTYKTPELPALNLARLYLKKGDRVQAKRYAKISVQKNWRYTSAYIFLAKLLEEENDLEGAKKILKEGVEANPDNSKLILEYAKTLLKLGQNQDARKWLEELITHHAKSDEAKMAQDYLEFLP
ncbi:Tfp pilus assembly protein PilF [Desulfonauticus submarinus]|uniref:Tfp pilus assembly protein PilF n=1 Tax=Desulfonauticus submarinus TaxID=206665 RepID=A0A1H0D7E4_9BACT|nr:tetratricopeptide repeat protein [Desulfonauticus submarinus]SDN66033.1 Tfp pilus assembly protein PilF [Desulfonauticus submarinus]